MKIRSLIASIVLLLAGFAPAGRGIYEDMFVPIGGIPQWITIKGTSLTIVKPDQLERLTA